MRPYLIVSSAVHFIIKSYTYAPSLGTGKAKQFVHLEGPTSTKVLFHAN